jgi:hypothetical protein
MPAFKDMQGRKPTTRDSPPPVRSGALKEKSSRADENREREKEKRDRRSPSLSTRAADMSLSAGAAAGAAASGAANGYPERYDIYYADEQGQGDPDDERDADEMEEDTESTAHISKSFRIGVLESQVASLQHVVGRHEDNMQKVMLRVEANMSKFNGLKAAWEELGKIRPLIASLPRVIQISSEKKCLLVVLDSDFDKRSVIRAISEKLQLTNSAADRVRVLPYTPPGKGVVNSAPALIAKTFRTHMESQGQQGFFEMFKMDYPGSFPSPDFFMVCMHVPILHGRLNGSTQQMEIFVTKKALCGQIAFKGRDFVPKLEQELQQLRHYPYPINIATTNEVLSRPANFMPKDTGLKSTGDGRGRGRGSGSGSGGRGGRH